MFPALPVLMLSAFALGLRHGIDWDHIAAITDIVGTGASAQNGMNKRVESFWLCTCYAVGHAVIVLALGVAAIWFGAILPKWIDSVMERVVGMTLLILGVWVFYSLLQFLMGKKDFQVRSRWTLILSAIKQALPKSQVQKQTTAGAARYGWLAAAGVGAIHGIGAETGTQMLLLAAVTSASQAGGIASLVSFAVGLIVSNAVIAIISIGGFSSAATKKPALVAVGVLTGAFSMVTGSLFVAGWHDALPNLQKLLAAVTS